MSTKPSYIGAEFALFVAAVSEAGYPPFEIVEYAPDHRAAFWSGDGLPGWAARKACDLLGLEPNPNPTDDGFHLGWRFDVADVASIAYELGNRGGSQ